jgi:hypothetical protein
MKALVLLVFVLNSMVFLGQEKDIKNLQYHYSFYSLGIGPSTIGGLSFMNEIGFTRRKSTFAFRGDFHQQLFLESNGHRFHDFFVNVAITYGRSKIKNDLYYEINFGPVFYGYFDEYRTSSSFFGTTTTGYRTREYGGFGFIGQLDFGKKIVKKNTIDYTVFFIVNTNLPIFGATARLNLRSKLWRLKSE